MTVAGIASTVSSPTPDRVVARRFLESRFAGAVDELGRLPGYLLITDRTSKRTFWCGTLDLAETTAIEIARRGHDADYHVALHDLERRRQIIRDAGEAQDQRRRLYQRKDGRFVSFFRGVLDSAVGVLGVWLDIDYGTTGHEKKRLPPDRPAALHLIDQVGRRLGAAPSEVVDTGGGFHVYWLFREIFVLDSDESRARFSLLAEALTRFAVDVAADVGKRETGVAWEIDSTHDLARVLRVAGTLNCKKPPHRPVRFEVERDVRYNLSDLESNPALAPLVGNADATRARATSRSAASCARPDEGVLVAVGQRVQSVEIGDEQFAAQWSHDESALRPSSRTGPTRAPDTSMSGWDYRLARWAHFKKWPDVEIFALLWLHHRKHGRDPSEKRDGYFQRTIGHARPLARAKTDSPIEVRTAPPPPAATRPIVKTALEARVACAEDIATWSPGSQSLSLVAFPGSGKTMAAARHALRSLVARAAGWLIGVAVLVLPTRELVEEKVEILRRFAQDLGIRVEILPLLGRSPKPQSGWYCEAGKGHALRAELMRSGCAGCPLIEMCESTSGRYRFERAEVIRRMRAAKRPDAPPVLAVTTVASLPWLWRDLPKKAPILIDDAGAPFGVVHTVRLRHDDLLAASHFAAEWRDRALEGIGKRIGDLVAEREVWDEKREERQRAFERLVAQLSDRPALDEALLLVAAWANEVGLNRFAVSAVVKKYWSDERAARVTRALKHFAARAEVLEPVLTADVVAKVLHALAHARDRIKPIASEKVGSAVIGLPEVLRNALRGNLVRPNWDANHGRTFPWETIGVDDGEDLRPAFSSLAVRVAREAVDGRLPLLARAPLCARRRGQPDHEVFLADDEMIKRAQAGFVAWLGVAPIPSTILSELKARQRIIVAEPTGLEIVVPLVDGWAVGERGAKLSFGPGSRKPGKPSYADAVTRAFAIALSEKIATDGVERGGARLTCFGAILHKIDFETLERPKWCGYYGANHAGTDAFEKCDVLLVRRQVPPYSEIAWQAAAIRHALRLPAIQNPGKTTIECRMWPGLAQNTIVLADDLECDLLRFHEVHQQLNAIGRCRPLSRAPNPTLVVLLAGRPFDGVSPVCKPIARVLAEFGIKIRLPDEGDRQFALEMHNEQRAREVVDRQDRVLRLLREHGPLSQRQLSHTLGASMPTIRRDLIELQAAGALSATSTSRCVGISIPRVRRGCAPLPWPSVEAVASLIRAADVHVPSPNTIRQCLRGLRGVVDRADGPDPVPLLARRSDQAEHYQAVAEAVARFLSEAVAVTSRSAADIEPPVVVQLTSTAKDHEAWSVLPPDEAGEQGGGDPEQRELFAGEGAE